MQNPWVKLPDSSPYVLEDDRNAIEVHNLTSKPIHQIELRMLPEPFLGQCNASVVLLNLNPGVAEGDIKQHSQADFIKLSRDNLNHIGDTEYPFYLLNPSIKTSPGYLWWYKRLRRLIEDCGHKQVAQNVLCVELFPYHSERYKALNVPSQGYSFYLVRQAIERNAIIIQMRSRQLWFKHVPELETYANWMEIGNPQSPYVSPNNLPTGYQTVVDAILLTD